MTGPVAIRLSCEGFGRRCFGARDCVRNNSVTAISLFGGVIGQDFVPTLESAVDGLIDPPSRYDSDQPHNEKVLP